MHYKQLTVACCVIFSALSTQAEDVDPQQAPEVSYMIEQTVPQDEREFYIDESKLPFDALDGQASQRYWGVLEEAGFRIEVPEEWNGQLVMWAHGYRGEELELTVDNPPIRHYLLKQGYAWAASSYSKNYYDARAGVESTHQLAHYFSSLFDKPERTFVLGASMGGHIAAASVEQYPNAKCPEGDKGNSCRRFAQWMGKLTGGVKYDGAVNLCGNLGDTALFDYFLDYTRVAETLAGTPANFPPPADYLTSTLPLTLSQIFANKGQGFPLQFSTQGEPLKDFLRLSSGGDRPVFNVATPFFQKLLFGFGANDGTLNGIVNGNLYDNTQRIYQLDEQAELSSAEQELNADILRIAADKDANPRTFLRTQRIPKLTGQLSVPTVTLHSLGDLFVPFSMQQAYAQRVAEQGNSHWLVQRAIRSIEHCAFAPSEIETAFADMIQWVEQGKRPLGDDVLDPEKVRQENFGCQFTQMHHNPELIPHCTP